MVTRKQPRPILSRDLAAVVGEFVALWAETQWLLVLTLSHLMAGGTLDESDDHTFTAVLVGMDARPLMSLVKTFGTTRFGVSEGKKLVKIIDTLDKHKGLRDRLCHGLYAKKGQHTYIRLIRTTGSIKLSDVLISVPIIRAHIQSVHNGRRMLIELCQKYGVLDNIDPDTGRSRAISTQSSRWKLGWQSIRTVQRTNFEKNLQRLEALKIR